MAKKGPVKKVAKVGKQKPAKAKAAKAKPGKVIKVAKQPAKKAKASEFQKVAFTLFAVENPERARGFYEGVLGFSRGLAAPSGAWTEYDLPGGGCLALFKHPNPEYARASGGASIAFEVRDLDALNERLKVAGVTYQGDMVHGPTCRMSTILDSEGNSIILHELQR